MTKKTELYACQICSNIVEVVKPGEGELVCCSKPMKKLEENLAPEDNAHYIHVENIEPNIKKFSVNHPMTPEHKIEFIEIISNDGKYIKRKCTKDDESAHIEFKCDCNEGFYARLYCNIHGCWVSKY